MSDIKGHGAPDRVEMAQWVRHLFCMHQGLSVDSDTHKEPGMAVPVTLILTR